MPMKRIFLLIACICAFCTSSYSQVGESEGATLQSAQEESRSAKAEVRVFPNPATLYFRIYSSVDVGKVVVINIIGKKVKVFEGENERRYDIEDLPMGIYLVQMLDEKGNIITTRRLSKRMP